MEDELQLRDFIRALWRQKWWMMLTTVAVMSATAAVSLKLPKIYRANAVLIPPEVDVAWPTPDGLKTRFAAASIGGAIRPSTTASDIIMGMLKSRRMALAVIDQFKLREVYPTEVLFKLPKLSGGEENRGPLLADIIEGLRNRTDIRVNKEGLLTINVEDRDPQRAAAMVQFMLDELQKINMEMLTTYNQYMARVLDKPIVPDKKFKPQVTIYTLIGGAVTVFLWMLAVLCRLSLAAAPVMERAAAAPQRPVVVP